MLKVLESDDDLYILKFHLNFPLPFEIEATHLCRQVDRDCDFLEQERIMDYSLLVGVHFRDSCTRITTEGMQHFRLFSSN